MKNILILTKITDLESLYIEDREGRLEYAVYNPGQKRGILCFHGFGLGPEMYKDIAAKNRDLTFVCMELLGHGRSQIYSKSDPSKDYFTLTNRLIQSFNFEQLSLSGFSLGARYALSMWQYYGNSIDEVFLIAPAGLTPDPWFNSATGSGLQKRLFKVFMTNKSVLKFVAFGAEKIGLISTKKSDVAIKFIQNDALRRKVYEAWVWASYFTIPAASIRSLVTQTSTRVTILLAQNDAFIDEQKIKKFVDTLPGIRLIKKPISHNAMAEIDFLQEVQ